jgi:hypothetical protein
MAKSSYKIHVYLEIGKKRTFAGVLDWPGWCRGGSDQESALQALIDYAPRYANVLSSARLGFRAPTEPSVFKVVERLKGDMTTDFGSPGIPPAYDASPVDDAELRRLQSLLKACWRMFDAAAKTASGKTLRLGARGGGRDLEKIVRHVQEAEHMYVTRLGWQHRLGTAADWSREPNQARQETLLALEASAHGELPTRGPRGGIRWKARYFVRRAAWHVLDHAWEIEDRTGDA